MAMYEFTVRGTGGNGSSWEHSGTVHAEEGNFPEVTMLVLAKAFEAVVKGTPTKTTVPYGKTCDGPYTITRLAVTRVADGNIT